MLTLAAFAAGGCAFAHRPHAEDPLLQRGRGVWGDLEKARRPVPEPTPEPAPPVPPAAREVVLVEG